MQPIGACSAFSGGPWLVLIFIYALFIPSTLRRASVVIGTVAAAPVLLIVIMALCYRQVAAVLTTDDLAYILPCLRAGSGDRHQRRP